MNRPNNAHVLLDAAEIVVMNHGFAKLTLDAVAAESGISKGGLLYHFPSKRALLSALVERSAKEWQSMSEAAYQAAPPGPGRMARGLIEYCFSDVEVWSEQKRASATVMFAALALDADLVAPMRQAYRGVHDRLREDEIPLGVSETVIAAIDGLWLNWALGLFSIDAEHLGRVRRTLEAVVENSASSTTDSPTK